MQPVLTEVREGQHVRFCRVVPLGEGLNALSESERWTDFGQVQRIVYNGIDGLSHKLWCCLDPLERPYYGKTKRAAIAAALEAHGMFAVSLQSTAPPLF